MANPCPHNRKGFGLARFMEPLKEVKETVYARQLAEQHELQRKKQAEQQKAQQHAEQLRLRDEQMQLQNAVQVHQRLAVVQQKQQQQQQQKYTLTTERQSAGNAEQLRLLQQEQQRQVQQHMQQQEEQQEEQQEQQQQHQEEEEADRLQMKIHQKREAKLALLIAEQHMAYEAARALAPAPTANPGAGVGVMQR